MGKRVLGIDPGTLRMGYGLVETREDGVHFVASGVLASKRSLPLGQRLLGLYEGLLHLLRRYAPDTLAVEAPFVPRGETSMRSAIAVGQAQALALMAAASQGIPCHPYSPAQVKETVAGYGRGSKEQVQEMVRLILGLETPPDSADAADALAVALCHVQHQHLTGLLASAEQGQEGSP
ncbi:MAG: crossover junction endodeoxyribonuclease RuvC [Chloroflexi bacterium]|nr:crossover junction endodeoxyribonuclease RuvC [Chloroflexota bacterium]